VTLVVDRIGLLVTNDPTLGDGPLGVIRDAAVVIDGGVVVAIERAGVAADQRVDADGRCVIPGYVDSHTHLVFAGDRSEEFAARMAGEPYSAGGIRSTVAATRATSDAELSALATDRRREALRDGTTHVEVKSGYGLSTAEERRLVELAATLTDDVTFLGAHTVPAEFEGRADDYVDLVCGEMLSTCAPQARWTGRSPCPAAAP
jgi:imidazolonepropionase